LKRLNELPIIFVLLIGILLIPISMMTVKGISTSKWFQRLSDPKLNGMLLKEQRPEFTLDTVLSGDFQVKYSNWFNQNFMMREFLIKLNNELYYTIFSKSYMYDQKIIIGKEGQLYERAYIDDYCNITSPMGEDKLEQMVNKMSDVQRLLSQKGIPFIILITPSKAFTYPEFIPTTFLKQKKPNGKNDYEQIMPLLEKNEINFVDGQKITLDLKKQIEYPLFARGGIHWNYLAASYSLNKLIEKINFISGDTRRKTYIERVETSDNPVGKDRDLLDLLNLWTPPDNYPAPVPVFSSAGAGNSSGAITVVGGSFCGMFLDIIREQKLFDSYDFFFYYKLERFTYPQKENGKPFNVQMLDWEDEIFNKNPIILEVNEEAFNGGHATAFLDDALIQLKYPGPLKTKSTGPLPADAYSYEMHIEETAKSVKLNEPVKLSFKVKNSGKQTWPSIGDGKYQINLGYHYENQNGPNEGRIGSLPIDLRPGQEVTIEGTVGPFKERGRKKLVFDMVHESVTWFRDHQGNKPITLTIDVQ